MIRALVTMCLLGVTISFSAHADESLEWDFERSCQNALTHLEADGVAVICSLCKSRTVLAEAMNDKVRTLQQRMKRKLKLGRLHVCEAGGSMMICAKIKVRKKSAPDQD